MSSTSLPILIVFLHCLLYSCSANLVSLTPSSKPAQVWMVKPFTASSSHPASPASTVALRNYYAVAPSPSQRQACGLSCEDPLTETPFGSPCGCVLPMSVLMLLDAAPLVVYPVINELEVELASGTYLKQSQVRIMGVIADTQNEGKSIVEVNLVPLGEKFDNITVVLISWRLWHKKVPLSRSLFGDYRVLETTYPGMPLSPPNGTSTGSAPLPSGNAVGFPFGVDFNSSSKKDKMNLRTIVIIAVCSILLFLGMVGGGFCIIFKWRKVRRPSNAAGLPFTQSLNKRSAMECTLSSRMTSSRSMFHMSPIATSVLSVKKFSLSELTKATDTFSSERILGEGGFGRVYHGRLDDGTDVAVKVLTKDFHQNGNDEFNVEVEMLSRLHHRNLVKLIGICTEGHKRCLVYELVRNGSVESHLHGVDQINNPLDWEARKKIALGAARGLAYLHEDSNPHVIHRDFKTGNLLLEDDFTPKISDFGLAREATEGSQSVPTRVMGTFGYVAPEYAMTGHLLVKSDVYSYGVVLLELLTGRKPVDMSQPVGEENLVVWARPLLKSREGLEQLVDPTLAGTYDFDEMAKVAAIASRCVSREVSERPFMGEVVQALKLIYNDNDEMDVDHFSPRESSGRGSDSRGGLSDSSWWYGEPEDISRRLTCRQAVSSSFITMDYSSGPLDEVENRMFSGSNLIGNGLSLLPIRLGNSSGPLRTARRNKLPFHRLTGSQSDHSAFPSNYQP